MSRGRTDGEPISGLGRRSQARPALACRARLASWRLAELEPVPHFDFSIRGRGGPDVEVPAAGDHPRRDDGRRRGDDRRPRRLAVLVDRPDAARGRVLLFLVISFAPFLRHRPLIGPVIDRIAGGRRAVISSSPRPASGSSLLMAGSDRQPGAVPAGVRRLVLQKTYLVCKSALVPSVVRTERELVEANSKLGVISGLSGVVAVVPAGAHPADAARGWGDAPVRPHCGSSPRWSAPRMLPGRRRGARRGRCRLSGSELHSRRGAAGGGRDDDAARAGRVPVLPPRLLVAHPDRPARRGSGSPSGCRRSGTMLGNVVAPAIRRRAPRGAMLVGGPRSSRRWPVRRRADRGLGGRVILAVVVNLAGASAGWRSRASSSAMRRQANRGRAFAKFETHFQLAWAVAGLIPVRDHDPRPRSGSSSSVACVAASARRRLTLALRPSPHRSRRARRSAPLAAPLPVASSSLGGEPRAGQMVGPAQAARRRLEAGQPEAGGVDLGRGRDRVGTSSSGPARRRRRGRRRPARTPCRGRPGRRRGGCRAAARRTGRWPTSRPAGGARPRRSAARCRRRRRTATASTTQSV